jgi:hypothetical protein
MNRRNLFRSIASIALMPLTPALAWANTQHEWLMQQARAADGVKGWPKLREIYPPVDVKNISHAIMRDELHALVNALDQDKTRDVLDEAIRIRVPDQTMTLERQRLIEANAGPHQVKVIE